MKYMFVRPRQTFMLQFISQPIIFTAVMQIYLENAVQDCNDVPVKAKRFLSKE